MKAYFIYKLYNIRRLRTNLNPETKYSCWLRENSILNTVFTTRTEYGALFQLRRYQATTSKQLFRANVPGSCIFWCWDCPLESLNAWYKWIRFGEISLTIYNLIVVNQKMNFSIILAIIISLIGSISADNIGWNRLSNNVNNLRRSGMNVHDYNAQMLRHFSNKDPRVLRKFLRFLQSQKR